MSKVQNELKNDALMPLRHSAEHVLHCVMQRMYPNLKKVMGPPIEDGFYFDSDLDYKITPEDLSNIESEMQKMIDANLPIVRKEISVEEAKKLFGDNWYKLENIKEIEARGEKVTVYITGEPESPYYDVDLCAGPHVASTGEIKAFRLLSIAGAYYKGDEKNKMLQRIYGTAFDSKEALDKYLHNIEEAKKRDHRKLGRELDLFCFSDLVGPGLPLYTPRGTIIKDELQKHIEAVCRNYGFEKVSAPSLAKIELFETSGHAAKFGEELFHVTSAANHELVLKPVQCPHHTQIYASKIRSYNDLPIRYMESDKQYRAEKAGEVGGLNRVYAITIEDGHVFCTPDQVKAEIRSLVHVVRDFYTSLGLWESHWVSLSVRDRAHPEKYIGDPESWDLAEQTLQEISDEMGLDAIRREGEAALYGPKLDFMFKDALGKEIQIPTIQLDFATPPRFKLVYIDKTGKEATPVMLHRAVLGSYERLMALLIEHFAGAFPVWLAPVQVAIIPISEKNNEYAQKVARLLKERGLRVEVNEKDEMMQAKIRDAQMQKVPYMLVLGAKEESEESVNVRLRDGKTVGMVKLEEFAQKVAQKYLTKALDLW
jgi:threonyl-tRNA synthetase